MSIVGRATVRLTVPVELKRTPKGHPTAGGIGVKIRIASQSGRISVFGAFVSEANFVGAACFPPC